ncbi:MAG TPA: dihydroorotate dehydrogenase electron transfer subunit [Vicinamibacterales bacterium]|nr:dihydroorotate dehydrogenase electron transfer subunit [Vicinamibacterales bacterium]
MPVDVAAEVISNVHLSSDYNVIALAAPEIAARALPGQFVMVKAGDRLEPLLRRPFSVFEILEDRGAIVGLSLLSKRIGPSTSLLFNAKQGDRIQCLGPLGRPFAPVAAPDEAWLVAGGVGLAPFATLAHVLRARNITVKLYYGARRAAELFYLDMFEKMGVELVLATEDGSRGEAGPVRGSRQWVPEAGRVTVPLERDLKQRAADANVMLYACGPEPMLAAVAKLAAAHGRQSQVSVERVMGCGVGGCYSCVIPITTSSAKPHFVRACIAGPVFRGSEIAW